VKRRSMRGWPVLVLSAAGAMVLGCATPIVIQSQPPGARILDNGRDVGVVTPGRLYVGDLEVGRHAVTVQKDGYRTPPPREFVVRRSVSGIVASVILPFYALPVNAAGDRWKEVEGLRFTWDLPGYLIPTFWLQQLGATESP